MNKKYLIGIAVLIIAVAAFIFNYYPKPPNVISITSDDGGFSLEIPKSALPDGFDASEIKIEKAGAEEIPRSLIGTDSPVTAYKLLPDGTVFKEPIRATMKYASDAAIIPYTFHVSDGDMEIPQNTYYSYDNSKKEATVGASITHFSMYGRSDDPLFEMFSGPAKKDWFKGEPIPFEFRIKQSGYGVKIPDKEDSFSDKTIPAHLAYTKEGTGFTVNGPTLQIYFHGSYGFIDPITQVVGKKMGPYETYGINETIKCTKSMSDPIEYATSLDPILIAYSRVSKSDIVGESTDDLAYIWTKYKDAFNCKEPVVEPPPPPPPPPTTNTLGSKYYVVKSTDPSGDTGNEVCAKAGKTCVGYTDLTLGSCLANHPGARISEDFNGSKAGFYCDGGPQGGVCAKETGTCHICPQCNINMDCSMEIGILYRETYVECK